MTCRLTLNRLQSLIVGRKTKNHTETNASFDDYILMKGRGKLKEGRGKNCLILNCLSFEQTIISMQGIIMVTTSRMNRQKFHIQNIIQKFFPERGRETERGRGG